MSYKCALAIFLALGWAVASAQTVSGGSGARPASPATGTAGPRAATPAQTPGVPAPVNQPSAPVDQPATSPQPTAPTPAQTPAQTPAPTSATQTPAPTSANTQQTVVPGTPNSANTTEEQRNRARLATQDVVPPASRGAGQTNNRPDCSKMSGIEKSECERRDTSRDDLPAGVTTTQEQKPPSATQGPPPQ
jgi:hypothetical protein